MHISTHRHSISGSSYAHDQLNYPFHTIKSDIYLLCTIKYYLKVRNASSNILRRRHALSLDNANERPPPLCDSAGQGELATKRSAKKRRNFLKLPQGKLGGRRGGGCGGESGRAGGDGARERLHKRGRQGRHRHAGFSRWPRPRADLPIPGHGRDKNVRSL